MSNENIDTVNIAVVEDREVTIHWGVQIPFTDTETDSVQVYLKSKGHKISNAGIIDFYLIDSIREVHYSD
tara:strand:- start:205 stop:414 length:210 start_codon:yes stop_codon:yes gene_type:complete